MFKLSFPLGRKRRERKEFLERAKHGISRLPSGYARNFRGVVLKRTYTRISCPNCGSHWIGSAGYDSRFQCQDCGCIFS